MSENVYYHQLLSSPFGTVGVVWRQETGGRNPRIVSVLLPREGNGVKGEIAKSFHGSKPGSHSRIDPVVALIERYLAGEAVAFSLDCLDLGRFGDFQRKVLRQEFQIPRGKVMSYGGLADRIGHPRAARAVGTALARNPFPLIIPCHRTVQTDGSLGGFGGGLKLKRALLEMEGVAFDRSGRVRKFCFWN